MAGGQTVPTDRAALEGSEGAGMALYAEMNGYPGPKHIIELQDQLRLSDDQLKEVQALFDEMHEAARSKGEEIIAEEEKLHALFAGRTATESNVKALAMSIGRLRGELRAVHLMAHVQAERVLTNEQKASYVELRRKAAVHQRRKQ